MTKGWHVRAGAVAAIALLLAGCSAENTAPRESENSGTAGSETSTEVSLEASPSGADLQKLIADGTLPADFPADADRVRLIEVGSKLAATWQGAPLSADCSAATSSPASYAGILLLQDVGLSDVQRCGDVWQATQADGSHVLWNTER